MQQRYVVPQRAQRTNLLQSVKLESRQRGICLPPHLQAVSKPFGDLAEQLVTTLPRNPERTVALRKLLEAKDAAVRALVAKDPA